VLLDLPWQLPLEEWPEERLVEVERGIGRHVVRFVELNGVYYALKELPQRLALREYRLLGELDRQGVPAVEVVGIVSEREPDLPAVLITRQLEFALPYRLILGRRMLPASESSIRAALAELLVRIHLVGLFWGDCSLSNALFRRDAGALSAYLVDVETGELHDRLSDGQREHDLAIAEENIVGELYDLAAVAQELDLLDVEAELVEATQPLLQPLPLAGGEDLLRRQLRPELLVPRAHVDRELLRLGDDVALQLRR